MTFFRFSLQFHLDDDNIRRAIKKSSKENKKRVGEDCTHRQAALERSLLRESS